MMAQVYYAQDVGHYAGYYWTGAPPISFCDRYISSQPLLDTWMPKPGEPVNIPPYVCPKVPQAIKTVPSGQYGYEGCALPYGWNTLLGGWFWHANPPDPSERPYFGYWRIDEIDQPATKIGWSECWNHGVVFPPSYGWGKFIKLRHGGSGEIDAYYDVYVAGVVTNNFANTVFLDGHVGRLDAREVVLNSYYGPRKMP